MFPHRHDRRSRRALPVLVAGLALILTACGSAAVTLGPGGGAALQASSPPSISVNPADGSTAVRLDAPVTVSVDRGSLDRVVIHTASDPAELPGYVSAGGRVWTLEAPLQPSSTYVTEATAHDPGGNTTVAVARFTTIDTPVKRLTTNPLPGDGSTVGVGMPIVLRFNAPIDASRQADLVRRLTVESTPSVVGAWHWFAADELHFRPKDFWPSGAKVHVTAHLSGFEATDGVWGLADWSENFTIGPKHLSTIDANAHQMQVYENDQLVHTYPVSTGREPRFPTLGGTLFVWYKLQSVRMDSLSLGIPHNSPLGYDEIVYWDTAISTDGFFIHSAPWSVWAQGSSNVSHGCVNLSPARAIEYFNFSQVGDVVQVTGTSRVADSGDGEADWQIPFDQYANSGGQTTAPVTGGRTPGGL
jgi:lipoprotein-anchoring transpeptidase ErfK/SrfK